MGPSRNKGIPFRYRLLLGFAVPLGIWVAIAIVNIFGLNHSIESSEHLISSQRVTLLANEHLNTVLRAQIGERGYIITGDQTFLVPYHEAVDRFTAVHAELAGLKAGNPAQLQKLQNAGDMFQRWVHDVAKPLIEARQKLAPTDIELARQLNRHLLQMQDAHINNDDAAAALEAGEQIASMREILLHLTTSARNPDRARRLQQALLQLDRYENIETRSTDSRAAELHELVLIVSVIAQEIIAMESAITEEIASGQGRYLVEEFRDLMNGFIATEQETLLEDQQDMAEAVRRARMLVWAGPALGLILMIIVASRIGRRTGHSLENIIQATNRLGEGDMQARAKVRADGEISTLAERFNAMAELVENRSRESAALAEFGELLQSCKNTDEIAGMFGRMAAKLFAQCPGALYMVTPGRDDTVAVASWANGEDYSKMHFQPDECWALRLGRAQENGPQQTVRCEHLLADERDSLCMPLHAFGETIGILFVTAPCGGPGKEGVADQRQSLRFINTVAEQLALALANLKLRETLRDQSIRDPLTHLYNRRYLNEILQREVHRAERQELPLTVMIFDIDHFKRFNDLHGHDGGDRLLEIIGDMLLDFYRTEDTAFRFGGEEFAVVLPGTTMEDALQRAEALRQKISTLKVAHGNIILPPVTISVGIACCPANGRTPEELLKAADEALYKAKKSGRDRVVAAESGESAG